ncbi:FYVE-type zinc finger-containing protein [Planoprotostelium fungivorum]|uniref:FYVE-type zinc finger-containing protein n=1 Tax=Planoprotostelium fungivorum TaxID=1890364 RepID=A0A2P6NC04_9EUKA|nr:FYVE-type zinc finger-containing protein [Planoprotostelium fungivorum]
MSSFETEFFLRPLNVKCEEIILLTDKPTTVGRKSLQQISPSDMKKKLNISREHAVFTPVANSRFMVKAVDYKDRILEKGQEAMLNVNDGISLLTGSFNFQLNKRFLPLKSKPTLFLNPIPTPKKSTSASPIKTTPNKSNGTKKREDRGSIKKSPSHPSITVNGSSLPLTPLKSRSSMSNTPRRTPSKRKRSLEVGMPVRFWDEEKKNMVTGQVMKLQNEDSVNRLAMIDVDSSGTYIWKSVSDLDPEDAMIQIREQDVSLALSPVKAENAATGRATRRRKVVSYTEWVSSDEEEEEEEEETYEKVTTEVIRTRVRKEVKRRRNYSGETVLTRDMLSSAFTAIFFSTKCLSHFVPKWHYEKPERLRYIVRALNDLRERYPTCIKIVEDITPIPMEYIKAVHDPDYLDKMKNTVPKTDIPVHVQLDIEPEEGGEKKPEDDSDTFMSKSTWEAVLIANGAIKMAIDQVTKGDIRSAFCAIRPPGHHCGVEGRAMGANSQGYCIVNNVVVGAIYARTVHNYQKIAIIDFDVHHGNGTEDMLGDKEGFLFFSIHADDIYPYTGFDDDNDERCKNIVNIGLSPGSSPAEFHEAFDEKIMVALRDYAPDLILLSAGFDAHYKDPTDSLRLESKDYFILTEKVRRVADEMCGGKMVSVLEGGYHLPSLERSVREHRPWNAKSDNAGSVQQEQRQQEQGQQEQGQQEQGQQEQGSLPFPISERQRANSAAVDQPMLVARQWLRDAAYHPALKMIEQMVELVPHRDWDYVLKPSGCKLAYLEMRSRMLQGLLICFCPKLKSLMLPSALLGRRWAAFTTTLPPTALE